MISADSQARFVQTWQQVAGLINTLPAPQRRALQEALRHFNHDLGDRVGLIRSAESLLRRDLEMKGGSCDVELMDIVRNAAQDLQEMVRILQAFAQAIQIE